MVLPTCLIKYQFGDMDTLLMLIRVIEYRHSVVNHWLKSAGVGIAESVTKSGYSIHVEKFIFFCEAGNLRAVCLNIICVPHLFFILTLPIILTQ